MNNIFPDAPDTAVIVTVYVVRHDSPILFVFHFDDGCWQFSGPEKNLTDEDYMVLGLGEIISLDTSVLKIANLPLGCFASRENIYSDWTLGNIDNE